MTRHIFLESFVLSLVALGAIAYFFGERIQSALF